MLDTATVSNYEANLRAHYRQVSQRLNRSPVPKPVNENPARSDKSLGQARLENSLAGAETCGVASIKPVEWVSAQDWISPYHPMVFTNRIATIIEATCQHYRIPVDELLSSERAWCVCRPRQVAMYLSKTLAKKSYCEIGRRFKGKHHTTILNAYLKILELLQFDQQLAADVAAIRALAVAADPGLAQ